MDKSPHVMMAGRGAEQFAAQIGCEMVEPSYFKTEESWKAFLRVKESACAAKDRKFES